MSKTFLVVDDHPIIHRSVTQDLTELHPDCQVLRAGKLEQAIRTLQQRTQIDMVLLDLNLPDSRGVDTLEALHHQFPDCRIVVFSGETDSPTILRCLEQGASGYIPKLLPEPEMLNAVRLVAQGFTYVPPQIISQDAASGARKPGQPARAQTTDPRELGLTDRQIDVLRLILQGMPNKLICRELNLAEGTVKVHVSAVLRLLGVRTRTQAVIAVSRLGLRMPT